MLNVEIGQVFTQVVSFLLMVWVLKRYAWKPLLKILDERQYKIQSDLDAIEDEKKETKHLRNEYHQKLQAIDGEAHLILKQANEKGQKIFKEIENQAHEKSKELIARTRKEMQNEIYKAKNQLKDEIVTLALSATQKMVKLSMDSAKQRKLVGEFIEHAENP